MIRYILNMVTLVLFSVLLCNCGGTIRSGLYNPDKIKNIRNAYIVENMQSNMIQNEYVIGRKTSAMVTNNAVVPFPIVEVLEGGTYSSSRRGDTELHIKEALEKHGISSFIALDNGAIRNVDVMIKYYDQWKWDLAWYIKNLKIVLYDPDSMAELAYGEFTNGYFHTFESPSRVVPKIIDKILNEDNK